MTAPFGACGAPHFGADELIVDNFAGGGGASCGIEMALGRSPDIAINHDPEALAMHAANHPTSKHLCENVWEVDIKAEVAGRKVGLAWFSPDCKHFSKAKGGKPVEKSIRGLAWVVLRWAGLVRPRVICLENVEEFQTWGPVVDGMPCKRRKGMTFKRWCTQLRNLGYEVDYTEMRACDYGAPTIRKRLFIVARRDGQPIVWPERTHAAAGNLFLQPYKTAADCIDWKLPCPSIFLTREEGRKVGCNRPLADATIRRIAKGVKKYVLDSAKPFIVNLTHDGGRVEPLEEPLKTVTGAHRGEKAIIIPHITRFNQNGVGHGVDEPLDTAMAGAPRFGVASAFLSTYYGDKKPTDIRGSGIEEPIATQGTENRHALVSAFLSRQFGGSIGSGAEEPVGTTTAGGGGKTAVVAATLLHNTTNNPSDSPDVPLKTVTTGHHHGVVASSLIKMRGTNTGQPADEPLQTVSAGGTHFAEVRAFLIKYFGTDQDPRLEEPLHTISTKDRFGLVTVHGEAYVIVDIGMRMLTPRELFRAQGFPDSYIIDRGRSVKTGKWMKLTKTAQVRMCGNSVSPYPAAALIRAQFSDLSSEVAA